MNYYAVTLILPFERRVLITETQKSLSKCPWKSEKARKQEVLKRKRKSTEIKSPYSAFALEMLILGMEWREQPLT